MVNVFFTRHGLERIQQRLNCPLNEIYFLARTVYERADKRSNNQLVENYRRWLETKQEGTKTSLYGGFIWFFKEANEGNPLVITMYRFTMDEAIRHALNVNRHLLKKGHY